MLDLPTQVQARCTGISTATVSTGPRAWVTASAKPVRSVCRAATRPIRLSVCRLVRLRDCRCSRCSTITRRSAWTSAIGSTLGTALVRPYVGAGGGFVRLDTIQSEFSVPAAGVVLSNVNMYDTSVVPSVGAGGGVQINLSDRFAVQGGVEFKWQGDATDLDGLAGTGLESINDESRRWSMPITGGITVRF